MNMKLNECEAKVLKFERSVERLKVELIKCDIYLIRILEGLNRINEMMKDMETTKPGDK